MTWQPGRRAIAKRKFSNSDLSLHIEPYSTSHDDSSLPSFKTVYLKAKRKMRSRQLFALLCMLGFAGLSLLYIHSPSLTPDEGQGPNHIPNKLIVPNKDADKASPVKPVKGADKVGGSQANVESTHPIWILIKGAEKDHEKKVKGQSQTLEAAVKEYRRRYGIPPPPNFDKWYAFAKEKGVQLIDEYDSIQHTLTPFWGLKPATIRGRAREALGFENNNLIGALIRNGEVKKIEKGEDWQKNATVGMMAGFIQHLPDMDLAFNIHDEPRVVVPSGDLERLVKTAKEVKMPAANANKKPRNSWTPTPKDLSSGERLEDVKYTRFNVFAHQNIWTHSRMSCSPDSPSRNLEDGAKEDNVESYTFHELGFVNNKTAFSDICQSPSLRETFGFFERPNAYNLVHDLFPIFSQSKISSYSDILYPSPWYWAGRVTYNETKDFKWAEKADQFYWRGSTTGGYSRAGGWRRQHRQKIVTDVNSHKQTKILVNKAPAGRKEDWDITEVPRSDYRDIFNIFFSHIGQCDPKDCDAQKEAFNIQPSVEQQDAWQYKYLLDMDGNAFSGRFYAFLESLSLVFKMAVFREWHEDWLTPWVHYIPLSLRGDEWVETLRWFNKEKLGQGEAERLALEGRSWARKVLRNDDMEVWFFRLLLE